MSKRQKRRVRIQQNPQNVRFEDLRTLLEDYGFVLDRSSGSHHTFKIQILDEWIVLVIPYARPVRTVYVKLALKLIEEIESRVELENDDEPEDE